MTDQNAFLAGVFRVRRTSQRISWARICQTVNVGGREDAKGNLWACSETVNKLAKDLDGL